MLEFCYFKLLKRYSLEDCVAEFGSIADACIFKEKTSMLLSNTQILQLCRIYPSIVRIVILFIYREFVCILRIFWNAYHTCLMKIVWKVCFIEIFGKQEGFIGKGLKRAALSDLGRNECPCSSGSARRC